MLTEDNFNAHFVFVLFISTDTHTEQSLYLNHKCIFFLQRNFVYQCAACVRAMRIFIVNSILYRKCGDKNNKRQRVM